MAATDSLSVLFTRFTPAARVFYAGELCRTSSFEGGGPLGHLHVVRGGGLSLAERGRDATRVEGPGLVFYPRGVEHVVAPLGSATDVLCATVDLGGGGEGPLSRTFPDRLVMVGAEMVPLAPVFDLLFAEAAGRRSGRQAALDALVLFFMVRLLRHLIETAQVRTGLLAALSDARLARVVEALHERPDKPWTLEAMADLAGMSRARFSERFKRSVGSTSGDYLTDLRLGLARLLLAKGHPVKSVAKAAGYADSAAFARVFRKRTGCSPRDWANGASG
ncbi:AraC family transcriptional regulator [Aquabacter spiritensis]|uniref:AraC family transcriptional regulator n=1 Tax=Aquabacter spiritensis TaxID=933073 RepID=A0A4R3LYX6_9HYPH|nr:AraC family transcriptional regulator [Aquabacter spiritensis]TCT05683.1 AraC family transcriptional regulator [Aquabacter spiritensis]